MSTTTDSIIKTIACDLVKHCKVEAPDGDWVAHDSKLWDKHFAESWVSVESDGQEFVGREAVIGKYQWWQDTMTCHSTKVSGPFFGPSSFSVIFDMDVEPKDGSWPRRQMKEVAIYTVENGKIAREEFQGETCEENCDCK